MKSLKYILLMAGLAIGLFYNPISDKIITALESNELITQEHTKYYEVKDNSSDMVEIATKQEYLEKIEMEKAYRLHIEEISAREGLTIYQSNVSNITGNENIINGAIITPIQDIPFVNLVGVSNGGSTTGNVTITYDFCYDITTTNKGAQYKIGSDDAGYTNFTSGTVFTNIGTYTIHVWNPLGHVYKTFSITRDTTADGSIYFTEKGYLSLTTKIEYRPGDNYAILSSNAYWAATPPEGFRNDHILTLICRNNDWIYDHSRGATFTKIDHYIDTYFETPEAIIVGEETGIVTNTLDVSSELNFDVEVFPENQAFDLNMYSYRYSLPNNENGYASSENYEWTYRSFYAAEYILSIAIKLRQSNATIGTYQYFPKTNDENPISYIDIGSNYMFSIQFPIFRKLVNLIEEKLNPTTMGLDVCSILISSFSVPTTVTAVILVLEIGTTLYNLVERIIIHNNTYFIDNWSFFEV